jgi:hypothetical protein
MRRVCTMRRKKRQTQCGGAVRGRTASCVARGLSSVGKVVVVFLSAAAGDW